MVFSIGVTDQRWFEYLRSHSHGKTVNFWTPTPWKPSAALVGTRWYFMIKAPVRKIGGYGIFLRYEEQTFADAWARYGPGNGCESQEELERRVNSFRKARASTNATKSIGCIELGKVILLGDVEFIDPNTASIGHSFPSQIVQYKTFHEADRLQSHIDLPPPTDKFVPAVGVPNRKTVSVKDRKGQSQFRNTILGQYDNKCCITGETTFDLLEAAHIQPFIDERSHHPQNGICLRVDLHRLFDAGLITFNDQLEILVSPSLGNSEYKALAGRALSAPSDPASRPSLAAIKEHRRSFRG